MSNDTRTRDELKRAVARRAAELVEDGMVVGLGTGSTAALLVDRLGELVRGGLRIRAVPTSERTAEQASSLGIPLVTLDECPRLDVAIDGADEVDPAGDLIKGLGGALYREKRVALAAREFAVIVDDSKVVGRLGVTCPVPVEIAPSACEEVRLSLVGLGARPELRGDPPYVTDNGNWILDAWFDGVDDAAGLEREINALSGVLDNGLFPGLATRVLVAEASGVREWLPRSPRSGPAPD